jgi:uncharacterized protein DUF5671
MIVGVLVPAAVLGTIVLIVVLLVRRGEGTFAPRGVLRLYLYAGSLAGIVALAVGLGAVFNYGIARVGGDEFVYGSAPGPVGVTASCPAGAQNCPPQVPDTIRRQQEQQREQRRNEDLIRGVTFTLFGALFWGAHWAARRGLGEEDPSGASLRRGYLMLGTAVFGLGTIVLLPTGIYQALANALLRPAENVFRPGADALGGGIVSLLIWLIYLRLAVTDLRRA